MPHSRHLQFVLILSLVGLISPLASHAQTLRAETPTVKVLESGAQPRERLAWQFFPTEQSWLQVSTRTVSGPRAVADVGKDALSVRRMYTLKGAFVRSNPITAAIWRIEDVSARLHDPTTKAGEEPKDPAGNSEIGTVSTEPKEKKGMTESEKLTTSTTTRSESFESRYARLLNTSLKKLNGSSIRQKVEPKGLLATGAIPNLVELTPREYSEAMNLMFLLGLGEVILPDTPIGIGAQWQAEMRNEISGIPIKTTITWTLKSMEKNTLKIGVTYKRRSQKQEEKVQSGRVNRDGVGEVTIQLDKPLSLNARLVQLPNAGNPYNPDVSWITITSLPLPGENPNSPLRGNN